MTTDDRDLESTPDSEGRGRRTSRPVWQESVLLLAAAIVVAIVVKAVLVQAFYIPSESMEPGLVKDDRILVQKPSYWFDGGPERGDVIVFADPGGWLSAAEASGPSNPVTSALAAIGLFPAGGHLVKRVIGVAGDTVTCCDAQGRIAVNGQPLDESSYARPSEDGCYGPMPPDCSWTSGVVPDGELFVLGDNRHHSADSSFHLCGDATDCTDSPFVPVDDVVGKLWALVWPLSRAGGADRPATFAEVPAP